MLWRALDNGAVLKVKPERLAALDHSTGRHGGREPARKDHLITDHDRLDWHGATKRLDHRACDQAPVAVDVMKRFIRPCAGR